MGKIGRVALCIGVGVLSACARRETAWAPPPPAEWVAHSPAVVFPADPAIAVADTRAPEFARRDAALGLVGDVRSPADLWPSVAPSVDRVRYLHLMRSAETTVIFRERRWWLRHDGACLVR
jgi:hypothetical protein